VVADTTVQKGIVSKGGVLVGTRQHINLIEGANVTMTITDDAANNRVNVTINGTTGGSQTPWTSDIQAAGFLLHKTGGIGIGAQSGNASPSTGVSIYGAAHFDALNQINTSANGYAGCNFQNDVGHSLNWRVQGSARAAPDVAQITVNSCNLEILRDTARRIIITTAGVGIGTPAVASPAAALHVTKGADNSDALVISGAANSQYMAFQSGPTAGRILHWNGSGMGSIVICPNGGAVMIGPDPGYFGAITVTGTGSALDLASGLKATAMFRSMNSSGALMFETHGVSNPSGKRRVIGWSSGVDDLFISRCPFEGTPAIHDFYISSAGFVGVGTITQINKLQVSGRGDTAEFFSNKFSPSANRDVSILVQETAGLGGGGGAIVFGNANWQSAAIRGVITNGTAYGTGGLAFYLRLDAQVEAMPAVMAFDGLGRIQLPFIGTANPGAGTKLLWADPADGYTVKFAV
jgi:hypothetical protein